MSESISPLAGTLPTPSMLVDVAKLVTAYFANVPDPSVVAQRVSFGTSGHRGSSFDTAFNEWHVLAITQAICRYRRTQGIDGPLFLGIDTHALSEPAAATALEVLAANGVDVMLAVDDEYTPTPVVSHAILTHNRGRAHAHARGLADGILITPSHNPPKDGGFKYNPPNGGPAAQDATRWIEAEANGLIERKLDGVKRMPRVRALAADTTHRHDFLRGYVDDLGSAIDLEAIRASSIRLGVDPLGGAGVHYWGAIAERYRIDLTVVSDVVDATFRFMTLDRDGQIRMDPSSPYAMRRLEALKDRFDVAFACDTDHDRHGIVTPSAGLLPPNHYLAVAIAYLFANRPQWSPDAAVGKTAVSTRLIDAVAQRLGRRLYEVPVGFKWFVDGLHDGSLGFGGEESAGASFLRRDGTVWTTDKDGITAALLSAEITARTGRDPGKLYRSLTDALGTPYASRVEAPATREQAKLLAALEPTSIVAKDLAGEPVTEVTSKAAGNGAAIGGIKVSTANGWFAARPSGTEPLYKIYAESFDSPAHLERLLAEAQRIVDGAIAPSGG